MLFKKALRPAGSKIDWEFDQDWKSPSLHFSISHTSSLIACGVTADMAIGIDVDEKQRNTRNNLMSFARCYFSPPGVDYLFACPDPDIQRHEFIKLWTLKEAYVKALGQGFSAAPSRPLLSGSGGPVAPACKIPGVRLPKQQLYVMFGKRKTTSP